MHLFYYSFFKIDIFMENFSHHSDSLSSSSSEDEDIKLEVITIKEIISCVIEFH